MMTVSSWFVSRCLSPAMCLTAPGSLAFAVLITSVGLKKLVIVRRYKCQIGYRSVWQLRAASVEVALS